MLDGLIVPVAVLLTTLALSAFAEEEELVARARERLFDCNGNSARTEPLRGGNSVIMGRLAIQSARS